MYSIRKGTFETNSSSTHSICICSEDQFEQWQEGKFVYDTWEDKLIPVLAYKEPSMEEIIAKARTHYDSCKQSFWKDWEDLSDEDQQKYFDWAEDDFKCMKDIDSNRYKKSLHEVDHCHSDLERDLTHFTSPSGDKMIAICYWGYE